MKLEYLQDTNQYGDPLIRLYDFNMLEVGDLQKEITEKIIKEKALLELHNLTFVAPINCKLTLRVSEEDHGITGNDIEGFYCDLTTERYAEMVEILEPFHRDITPGRSNWLYDLNVPCEFLISPDGSW